MILCQCKNVSHPAVDAAIAAGARTVGAIGRACGAGTECGGCVCRLKERFKLAERPAVPARDTQAQAQPTDAVEHLRAG